MCCNEYIQTNVHIIQQNITNYRVSQPQGKMNPFPKLLIICVALVKLGCINAMGCQCRWVKSGLGSE